MKPTLYTIVALALLATTGCSKATYPVYGRVTFSDGTPVANAYLIFESLDQKSSSKAFTDAEGNFALSTYHEGDGAYLGEYRALVMPPAESDVAYDSESGELVEDEEQDDYRNESRHAFDPKYTRFEASGLNFVIEKGSNKFDIVLNRT